MAVILFYPEALMSSTVTIDWPTRQTSPDPLAEPISLPLSFMPADPLTGGSLTSASVVSPALADILFDDYPLIPPDAEAPAAAPFKIDSFDKAAWAASRILEAQARVDQRSELARVYKARIDAWLSDANSSDNDSINYLSALLKPWVEFEVSKQRRSRSILLPTATAQLRKLPDRIDIIDSPTALSYLKANHPEAVVVHEDISKSAVRSLIFTEGEAIPGIEAELGNDELYVKRTEERRGKCAS